MARLIVLGRATAQEQGELCSLPGRGAAAGWQECPHHVPPSLPCVQELSELCRLLEYLAEQKVNGAKVR